MNFPCFTYKWMLFNTQSKSLCCLLFSRHIFKMLSKCCVFKVRQYMYQWQNQHALPLVPGWILVPSDPWRWQEKLLCSVVTALTSTLCAALHGQSNVGSMCDCKPCWSLDLSVLVEILSGVDSDHGTGRRRNGSVNSRSTLCPIESGHAYQRRSFKLSSGCLRFVNWAISSCLTSQASKLY